MALIEKKKFMKSSLKLNLAKEISLSNNKPNSIDLLISQDNLICSKFFWIYSIYFFVSILMLTSLHMYEYLKCNFC